jgi:hypothetical protein
MGGLCLILAGGASTAEETDSDQALPDAVASLVHTHCLDCHSSADVVAGIDLESISEQAITAQPSVWEKVVKKLAARQMPPADAGQPEESAISESLDQLVAILDQHAIDHPQPGRTETFRRLTRFEYQNVIRDLLSLDIDVTAMLPADEVSHGFDNITVGELSPTLVNRYISAAQTISRLAVGRSPSSPEGQTIRIRPDLTQEEHIEGLPIGTRGGVLIPYHFPQDGQYEVQIRLARDRDEHVEGLSEPHELELLLDLDRVQLFKVQPPGRADGQAGPYGAASHEHVDQHLQARFSVTAGPHQIGVAFLKQPSSLLETQRQPLNVHFNMYRHPRIGPAVYQVSITGPFAPRGVGQSPSRQRVFGCWPDSPAQEEACAQQILTTLLRRACRQPIEEADLASPMELYRQARQQGDFEDGIELALSSVLVHPRFLFRIERDPPAATPRSAYPISDLELASRLSFFLWSSIPDDELLEVAVEGRLRDPQVLEQQTRRMLVDPRCNALVENFAGQWLYLRNLDSITPDGRLYPDFDDNLRQAMRRETELLFESIVREDRSVVELLRSDHTYLNERLAKHYGIPHVHGTRFRRVPLDPDSHRGGLLRHASILTVTSYATRTSPVIRGKWILENLLGTPPPAPPPGVPALSENTISATLPLRQRLAQHRADPACASCHELMDPVGFALENFDAVGRWRDLDAGRSVDAAGGLPDGRRFQGVDGLEQGLLERPELFVATMAEKLLTYAIGRGHVAFDAPAVRQAVRRAAADDYRFSSLILGIVQSTPFQMRTTP